MAEVEAFVPDIPLQLSRRQEVAPHIAAVAGGGAEMVLEPLQESDVAMNGEVAPRDETHPVLSDHQRAMVAEAYKTYGKRLTLWIARSYPNYPTEPEEVVQEAFFRLSRNAAIFEQPDARIGGWLYRVAQNLVVSAARKASIRGIIPPDKQLMDAGDIDSEYDEIDAIIDEVTLEALLTRIEGTFGVLGQIVRPEVQLGLIGDDEIAAVLGISVATVRTRRHRLRAAIVKQGFDIRGDNR